MSQVTQEKDAKLHTDLAGIAMNTPVLTASGTFGFGEEFADFVIDMIKYFEISAKKTCRKSKYVVYLNHVKQRRNYKINHRAIAKR